MRFDFKQITNIINRKDRLKAIQEMIKACPKDDPFLLSDLLVRKQNYGGDVLQKLGMIEAGKSRNDLQEWKIFVMRDEWGNGPAPGDKVIKTERRGTKDEFGDEITPEDRSMAMLDGSYDEKYLIKTEYTVDEKGCISCPFEDAIHFLNLWGLHAVTGRTLTTKKAYSKEPLDAPNGDKIHVWYWRYKEVSKEQYAELPKLDRRKGPRRGYDKLTAEEMKKLPRLVNVNA